MKKAKMELRKIPIFYKILFYAWILTMTYFMFGILNSGFHEGYWEILFQVSGSLILPSILIFTLIAFSNDLSALFSDLKLLLSFLFLFGLTLFFFDEIYDEFYYPLFENKKTVVSTQYLTSERNYRGTMQYYLHFDDDNNDDDCDPKYEKCRFSYKVRINPDTHKELSKLSDWVKQEKYTDKRSQLIEVEFKPKAQILMNYTIKNFP